MGSIQHPKTTNPKRKLGKVDTLLNEKLQKVEWGEFKIEDVLQWQPQKEIDPLKLKELTDETEMIYPFYGQATTDNGIISYNQLTKTVLNNGSGKPTILIHSNNQNIVYVETPFYLKDGHGATSVLQSDKLNKTNQMFIIGAIDKVIKTKYSYNNKATKIELKNSTIQLPTKKGTPPLQPLSKFKTLTKVEVAKVETIDFDFMESFVAELAAQRVAELAAHLKVTGLKDYNLTNEEQKVLEDFENMEWKTFNLQSLFGKATRGQRLKSTDRISGNLPFVTAGEFNEGISAFIGNDVTVFSENTTTIDMFGSAKYRNYKYGGDDHVAIVHTENLPKLASIFVTSAIHKTSSAGQFSYSNNFYAKHADELNISLPTHISAPSPSGRAGEGIPNYALMETFITAIQKLVIKEVVLYADSKIEATKLATQNAPL